ncbi:hypothetical protein F4801DRAFT_471158 [Xylaria longipes]|nr:hypothetical protein F4801DRAFT_471158 [Xylaria longipes]RYC64992.1 hypothetical protein CHU98_g1227 [Xylaria longipes]
MSKLPIKVQIGIRDSWDNEDAPVQKAIRNLKEVVGVKVTVHPEWPLLHAELGAFYPDKATLAPSVATAVEACCTAFSTLADDEENAEWADTLLERTESHIRISIEASKDREMGISWSNQEGIFVISLPKSAVPSKAYILSFFTGNLLKVFDEKAKHDTLSTVEPVAADDWADVAVDNKTGNAAVIEMSQRHSTTAQQSPAFDVIPDVGTISRPDELLLKPPYHLIMHSNGKISIDVQCSHSPTLQFMADYLKKWSKTNHNNTTRPPCAEVQLHQSAFGLGVVYDRLTIVSESRYHTQAVSPTIVLSLVEGVLGYKNVSSEGSTWTFRKDVEFRSSRY